MRPFAFLIALTVAASARAQVDGPVPAAPISAAASPAGPIPADSRQLILVVTPEWGSTTGALRRFERSGDGAAWRAVGSAVEAVVGRNGLGWGRGRHGAPESVARPGDPLKREGDGRAPAGVFALTEAFGYAPPDSARTGLPYRRATPDLECVDDAASLHYNRVLDRTGVAAPDWSSHEEMRRGDRLYRRGVVVAHNAAPAVPGGGSCIFLHVWRGPGSTTSGCTAMPEGTLAEAMAWLDAAAAPVLVQLPAVQASRLRSSWGLPELPRRSPVPIR